MILAMLFIGLSYILEIHYIQKNCPAQHYLEQKLMLSLGLNWLGMVWCGDVAFTTLITLAAKNLVRSKLNRLSDKICQIKLIQAALPL